ncbi:MAG: thioesterase family protein [Oscillospiraceae bacterium]|nr:thioesterase family protein [Oscillospiraceae bacterium]
MRILLATLQSHSHIVGDIERGVKIFEDGGIEFAELGGDEYTAAVPHKDGEKRNVFIKISHNKCDIEKVGCYCTRRYKKLMICQHVVAAVLQIQGGIIESRLEVGKIAAVKLFVNQANTANVVESGELEVFSTPSMIAAMEKAACHCLEDGLEEGETSVGTKISVEHIAATPVGKMVTAVARIDGVFGRRIELSVTAYEGEKNVSMLSALDGMPLAKKIGFGSHTRAIVDADKFMARLLQ